MARLAAKQIAAAINRTRLRRDEAICDFATMLGCPEIGDFVDTAMLCRAVRDLAPIRYKHEA